MDLLFAAKALASVIAFAFGIVLVSFLAGMCLRLAVRLLGLTNIQYFIAFKAALISNFAISMLNVAIGFNHGFSLAVLDGMVSERSSRPVDFAFSASAYSPIYFLYATIFGLLVTAAIFSRTLHTKETDSQILFRDAFALASLYFAITFSAYLVLGLLAFCIVAGFLASIGA